MSEENQLPEDDQFYERADEFISLANKQCNSVSESEFETQAAKVSASFMYANARFSTWLTACGYSNADDMRNNKELILQYFLDQYKMMLEDNFEEYASNFEEYMNVEAEEVKRFV
ncbi:DUF3144 domain-containing protein [Acinetobacter chinensis]|jgi:hypothetical protein|uniref:DUF3144 domain-containing protein n=1 Tax=Acinetobacter chinensis TaxID=2004650 RepID=A0A3B7LWL4_9GAMM|nr:MULTISPECIES: DUF3144 domain-containing protein [Acinetobacter]AXY57172.1 DUF3144 domain-containing protein [Acinetobacter chinensis]AXY60552.1 DUF3144 domain-containing protein [Acinetobacter sp. WCHAc010052]MDV2468667.1 DUF3144 domain-containing protein [Acinetobacter chinensis]WOE40473.1 DUF3144 domain-containing protein [Acinetobacter chinensis]